MNSFIPTPDAVPCDGSTGAVGSPRCSGVTSCDFSSPASSSSWIGPLGEAASIELYFA
eukprot:CAMPEP_0206171498 /NCGR_PEP_ID=MMETSP1474-20131121/42502_1 /ASSEMBLY_ACC=CAM_ASM_001110 /TAXON_ID=97495 /ORGANISM="Imantonia sp., Strain RCC918" /LENGTH=57 /DNA_ID=CAMNT_0053578983 /DNA_START=60 /DNA_END=229 /DNA_ORIENTATION=+